MDSVYLKKVREGDTGSFSYFVEKYSSKSYSLALSLVKNETEAEDIVQASFIKAYKAIPCFREDAKFSTWLYRIVVNECQQSFRKKRTRMQDTIETNESDSENNSEKRVFENEKKQILNKAIANLKSREALLIRLYYLCELDMEEIREVTGLNLANCKVILHRARKSLKTLLEKQFSDEINSLK